MLSAELQITIGIILKKMFKNISALWDKLGFKARSIYDNIARQSALCISQKL